MLDLIPTVLLQIESKTLGFMDVLVTLCVSERGMLNMLHTIVHVSSSSF